MVKKLGLILGPIIFLIIYNLPFIVLSPEADKVIAVTAWMIIWWVTETVSISVTALIPLTIFPLVGIMDMKSVSSSYGSPIVFLFFGGFVMALALEKVNLHKRIALNIVKITGTTADKVILGFMLATALLSMWISNTATTVVMLPIAASVINLLVNDKDGFTSADKNFALSLMLAIAYSANVGGIATIIGTPPNTILVGFIEQEYQMEVSFLHWMMMGVPFSLMMLMIIYFVLVKFIYPNGLGENDQTTKIIESQLTALGPVSKLEKRVLQIFIITMLLWVFRVKLNVWFDFIKLSDAGISLLAALTFFVLPFHFKEHKFVLEWEDTKKLPWGILILFGGGLALASALSNAGVIEFIGIKVASYSNLSILLVVALLIGVMLFMTELMSNVALVAIFAPVLAGIAIGLDYSVIHLLIPVTMAASCAFMLPMATPPNAIVFASGYIKVHEMVKAGFFLNIISIVIIIVFAFYIIPYIF